MRGWWVCIPATALTAWIDLAVLHWLLPLGDPGVAIGQCRSGGITVATVAPAHGADNVVPDNEDSGGPPLPLRGIQCGHRKKSSESALRQSPINKAVFAGQPAAALFWGSYFWLLLRCYDQKSRNVWCCCWLTYSKHNLLTCNTISPNNVKFANQNSRRKKYFLR